MNEATSLGITITQEDLATLFGINPLAAEQIRRIRAERLYGELQARTEAQNGDGDIESVPPTDTDDFAHVVTTPLMMKARKK